eukprot:EG_transcript_4012
MGGLAVPLLLLALLALVSGRQTSLKVAFSFYEPTNDMSWSWRMNQGRIYMLGQLLDLYPDLSVQTFSEENVPDGARPPDCPVFEAWAAQGMDLVVGTSYGHQYCMAYLAPKYPNTVWFAVTGDLHPNLTNWGLGYARIYQTIYLAGMVAGQETRTGRVGACMPVVDYETYSHLAAFALGVAAVNASVKVVAAWTNEWLAPERDVFIVQRMATADVDIVFHRCGSLESISEAVSLGMRSIGFNADFTMLAEESVLVSPYYNWGVPFLQVARLVVEGNYSAAVPVDLFPGLESDAVGLSDPSYLVRKATMLPVRAMQAALRNGTSDTFCGRFVTNAGTVVGRAGVCPSLQDMRGFDWEPWNVVDRGHYALPSEACYPGEQSWWDTTEDKYLCTACPAGTYSQLNSNLTYEACVCLQCPADTYSLSNASDCSSCPSGYAVTAQQDGCSPIPMATAVLVGVVVAAVVGTAFLLAVALGVWRAWKATADLRKLRKQFSNNNVAQECAEAIACFNLESVAWLRTCPNPNRIQQSFLEILEMLTMVKPYIPDHVLSLIMKGDASSEAHSSACDPAPLPSPPKKCAGSTAELRSKLRGSVSSSCSSLSHQAPHGAGAVAALDSDCGSTHSPQQPPSAGLPTGHHRPHKHVGGNSRHAEARLLTSAGEWVSRRCVYMVVTVAFDSPAEMDGDVPHHVGQMLADVIAIGKNSAATLDHVTYDRVALHWGLVSSVSEAALKATSAALDMGRLRGRLPLPWRTLLRLSVSVVQGFCNVATISAAGHRFF